ncbi:unnamed protein product [Ceratitis capitata]|uniref:(Mediterranean fruit fly) hypothetical protein n=1 Tax=Ceratitis capitata TaxID=7213 RepID=A0A811V6Y2_CERCA|nr:unnamed protein product [Ceratitis capitata]
MFLHVHNNNGGGGSSSSSSSGGGGGGLGGIKASSAAATATSMAAVVAASVASTTSSPASVSHLGHHHHHTHHHHHHPNNGLLAAASLGGMGGLGIPVSCAGLRGVASGLSGLTTSVGVGVGIGSGGSSSGSNSSGGLLNALSLPPGHVPDICPICGVKISAEEWNSHFLTELDRLYKLSSGMERTNLQASYMFAPPCPAQENAIRTSHNRWETFQRIRNNRQNRLRIKGRKRKYGNDLYFMENLFCNSCPICKRKYAIEAGKMPPEEDVKMQEEIETVDVESCNDDVPDSGSELATHSALGASSLSHGHHGNMSNATLSSNMHSNNNQPGKLDGILYRTARDTGGNEDDLNATSTSGSGGGGGGGGGGGMAQNWSQTQHHTAATITTQQGHISVKNVSELSSTTHHFYNADSCGAVEERASGGGNCNGKDVAMDTCNANDSDEDVIVDDDDSIKMTNLCSSKKRKYEETVVSSRTSDNPSPMLEQERPRSEPQVTSTEPNMEIANNNNNNNNNNPNIAHSKSCALNNSSNNTNKLNQIICIA